MTSVIRRNSSLSGTGLPTAVVASYLTGEFAFALAINGLSSFALLYYTGVVGLSPALAGLALAIGVFWEAATQPLTGYLSDRTQSRYGSRHPWMAVGGFLIVVGFYLLWNAVLFAGDGDWAKFGYLLACNLIVRTGLTLFVVPFIALGFEMTPTYDGRTKLQSLRVVINEVGNFAGPAMAWSLFFYDRKGPDGRILPGTQFAESFSTMGLASTVAIAISVLVLLIGTRRLAVNCRSSNVTLKKGAGFWRDARATLFDPYGRWIFGFVLIAQVSMVVVGSLQVYLYDDLLRLVSQQKTVAAAAFIIACGLGAALSGWLAERLDKRPTALAGLFVSVCATAVLGVATFLGYFAAGGQSAFVVFVAVISLYWAGSGVVLAMGPAMIGDVAELRHTQAGESHEGSYSAMLTLCMRVALALGLILTGWILQLITSGGGSLGQANAAIGGRIAFAVASCALFFSVLAAPLLMACRLSRRDFNETALGPRQV
jgi:glycoside/pentoside/hexuronide:cation symporter, GPH family